MEQTKQYEYDFDDFVHSRPYDNPREHQEYLNRMSTRGWEMVNAVTIKQYNNSVLRIYWKREKTTNIE
jgi:hypothetical protein